MLLPDKSAGFCYRQVMKTVGKRLRAARRARGLSQEDIASVTMNSRELISLVENGRSGLSPAKLFTAAEHLNVSMDYLFGLTDDPTPSQELTLGLKTSAARIRDLEQMQDQGEPRDDADYVAVSEVTTAAGTGATIDTERVSGRMKFPRTWLNRHGLSAPECRIIRVAGRVDGTDVGRWLRDPRQPSKPPAPRQPDIRHPDRRRTDRQASRQRPRRRLAAGQRQPEQDGVADAAVAARGQGRRRGQVGRTIVHVTRAHRDGPASPVK